MCVHAVLRPAKQAWLEQLWLATAALALLPLLNVFTTHRPLWHSLAEGDWVFAGVDLMLWALAALHAMLAVRTARHSAKVRPARRAAPLRPTPSSAGERA
jgi:hypothetical protein